MTVLDADMTTVGRWLGDGWQWWIGELQGMIPGGPWLRPRAAVAIWDGEAGFVVRRRGQDVAAGGPALVAMPARLVLVRALVLPSSLGSRDVGRLVALDADRLLPFPAGSALVDHRCDGGTGGDGAEQQSVLVAAVRKVDAQRAAAAARLAGIEPRGLGVVGPDGTVRFDFLPALRADAGDDGGAGRRRWWAAVAGLALFNLVLAIGIDRRQTAQLQARQAADAATAATARRLRDRVVAEDRRRRDWLQARTAAAPLAVLAATTRALPDGAWLRRFEWDGRRARMSGAARSDVDAVAALRQSPDFRGVQATSVTGDGAFEVAAIARVVP